MSFSIVFDPKALDQLAKLEKSLRERIYRKIEASREEPERFFERMNGRTDRKLRVGDYRILADIRWKERRIEITLIGHRENIYEKINK